MITRPSLTRYWVVLGTFILLQYVLFFVVLIFRLRSSLDVSNVEGIAYLLLLIESFLFGILLKTQPGTRRAKWMRVINIGFSLMSVLLFVASLIVHLLNRSG